MSEPAAKRSRPSSLANRGAIARMRLHNFMSYRDAEISQPGERLNCIVGPNGTGKSSIVCAMCVGLGGPLKLTERGDSIKSCVHGEGKQKNEKGELIEDGYVETELVDGNGPGRNLTVKLVFDIQGKTTWYLDGSKTTKERVKETMKSLNIQVDNPLQFLPQDKVGAFSSMSPVDLLRHTEMAIGPEVYEKHLELIELDKEVATTSQRLTTEENKLEDLARINRSLAQDVERFRRLQENKKKLDGFRGKLLWSEFAELEAEAHEAREAKEQKKAEHKKLKDEYNAKCAAVAPLEEAKKAMEKRGKQAQEQLKRTNADCSAIWNEQLGPLEQQQEDLQSAAAKVDKRVDLLQKKVAEAEAKYADEERKAAEHRRHIEESRGSNVEEQKAALQGKLKEAAAAHRQKQEAQRVHGHAKQDLVTAATEAVDELQKETAVIERKRQLVVDKNRAAAQLAYQIEEQPQAIAGFTPGDSIGPLLMHIDVLEPSHQRLVEEAIGPKYAFAFLASSDGARAALNRKVASERWNVNIYRYSGGAFTPSARPRSEDMRQWGVTAWLDEAVQIPPEHRDQILGALKDLTQVDKYLLGTAKTSECIEELQAYIAAQGMDSVTVLTPQRTYQVRRSRYGERKLINTTTTPKASHGLYANSTDEDKKRRLELTVAQTRKAVAAHQEEADRLGEAVEQAGMAKQHVMEQLQTINSGLEGLQQLEARCASLKQRLEKAQAEEAAFDVDAQREGFRTKLRDVALKHAKLIGKMGALQAKCNAALVDLVASQLSHKVAHAQALEVHAKQEELGKSVDDAKAAKDAADRLAKERADEAAAKRVDAKKAAKDFEKDKDGVRRNQAEWDAMPEEIEELRGEIESLEEDIAQSGDDDGKTLRDYEERCKQIEAATAQVEDTKASIADQRDRLADATAVWKPKLQEMVTVVDKNFADYFGRFRCVGRVELTDGRKPNPATGEPEGPDDFAQYKVHIKVKWRDDESLHVLGEGGRDSGGERSVATMVYLISLQSINPAPFRVVDEINQAMDSTNERHVFECITHACRGGAEGGSQYFLLTPKLLPDLEYGAGTAIQLVLNGPHNVDKSAFALANYT